MDAVRGIDLQFRRALLHHHFVNRRGTKILAGIAEFAHAAVAANIRVENDQMAGLIFVVARSGMIDVREAIKGKLAIAFESRRLIHERGVAMELYVFLVAGLGAHRIDQAAPAGDELQAGVNQALPQAVVESLMEIPHEP